MNETEFTNMVRYATMNKTSYNKLFCIGFNKTGTTTLERVLRLKRGATVQDIYAKFPEAIKIITDHCRDELSAFEHSLRL